MNQLAILLSLSISTFFGLYGKEVSPAQLSFAKNEMPSIKTTVTAKTRIYFSGLWWSITNAIDNPRSPGGNYWSAANVWVDSKGLHLKLSKDLKTGKWYCTQIVSEKKFGYGTYQFFIDGRVDQLDKNVVFGLFNYSKVDYHDEMDIEFAKWGKETNLNLHYTIWPAEGIKTSEWTIANHFTLNDPYSTHRFKRTPNLVNFQSLHGFQQGNAKQIYSITCKEKIISKKSMPILINLWMFNHQAPSDNQEVELIVKEFRFIPL